MYTQYKLIITAPRRADSFMYWTAYVRCGATYVLAKCVLCEGLSNTSDPLLIYTSGSPIQMIAFRITHIFAMGVLKIEYFRASKWNIKQNEFLKRETKIISTPHKADFLSLRNTKI